jgi:hypothetical protein
MKLQGVSIDFDDVRTCGLLPHLCLKWDFRTDEMDDNTDLVEYWEGNLKKILAVSSSVVAGNLGTKSIVYSADERTIGLIDEIFKELQLEEIEYESILKCENCLHHDYLDENFIPEK